MARVSKQVTFEFRKTPGKRGGRRPGAGRPRKQGKRNVAHVRRARFTRATPVHVTMRLKPELESLRKRDQYRALRKQMFISGHKPGYRICHFSIQRNHVHLIVEAANHEALARGMSGFTSWSARRLNGLAGRKGSVFGDRYHSHVLRTPSEVRRALGYVISNWRRHDEHLGSAEAIDRYSSGDFFAGWKGDHGARHRNGTVRPRWLPTDEPIPVAAPQTWLLTVGWQRAGDPLSPYDRPGPISKRSDPGMAPIARRGSMPSSSGRRARTRSGRCATASP